jgi:hypothetical protein
MRTSVLLGLIVATSAMAFAGGPAKPSAIPAQQGSVSGATYQALGIKTGLWEVTYSRSSSGDLPMTAGLAAHLTPEQRARYEAAMNRDSTHTYKSCVKKEDVDGSLLNSKNNRDCKVTILKSTSSELDGKMACNMEGMDGNGTMNMHVIDSEHTKGVTHMTMTGNGKTFNTDATLTSKWISSDCKGAD